MELPPMRPVSPIPAFVMKNLHCTLVLALSLAACGEPPQIVEPESERDSPALPRDHPPIDGGGGSAASVAEESFSASGTVRLSGVESFEERACLFVTVRAADGPLWLMKQVLLAEEPIVDGACEVSFEIDAADRMPGMMAGPKPDGALNLHVSYTPSGFVENQVAAEPIAVEDGDAGIEVLIELAGQ